MLGCDCVPTASHLDRLLDRMQGLCERTPCLQSEGRIMACHSLPELSIPLPVLFVLLVRSTSYGATGTLPTEIGMLASLQQMCVPCAL